MNNVDKIILIGYGGHAESMADSIQQSHQFEIVGYTDISPAKKSNHHEAELYSKYKAYYGYAFFICKKGFSLRR